MKITVFAAGSRGDIQPCVVLGQGLQQAGYQVLMAAPKDFSAFIQSHNLDFYPLRADIQEIMASQTGKDFMEKGGGNPLSSIRAIRKMIAPVMNTMTQDLYDACRDSHALVCLGIFSAFGHTVAEALDIPLMNLEPTPLLPSREFPAPSWPFQRNLGGWHNYLSGRAMLGVVWLWYRPFVNEFRHSLGLKPLTAAGFYRILRSTPLLSAYSPGIIPRPADWPVNVHVTGYFFLDSLSDWQPSPKLEAFLAAGEPPVYIGFGSMAGKNPRELARVTLEALEISGRRGLILTGWGGISAGTVPENVFVLDSAPHSWLFPRMAAVVHHGGAGTTAEGLRAGVPSIIIPFILDQPFWGARIKAMGLGPAPIPKKKLTAQKLAAAINQAVMDFPMKKRAELCGRAIRGENGVENGVNLVRQLLGDPGTEGEG